MPAKSYSGLGFPANDYPSNATLGLHLRRAASNMTLNKAPAGPLRCVVTGGLNGIGREVAVRLHASGGNVVVIDRTTGDAPVGVGCVRGDLLELPQLGNFLEQAIDKLDGRIDVLVNCAGIYEPTPIRDFDLSVYERVMSVNLHAAVQLSVLAGCRMAEQSWGRIVAVASIHAGHAEAGSLAYGISKAALEQACRGLAVELAPYNVLVNSVSPGFVDTDMARPGGMSEYDTPIFRDFYVGHRRLPLGRPAHPSEVAEAIAWLASPENSYMTGSTLTIDGGLTATF